MVMPGRAANTGMWARPTSRWTDNQEVGDVIVFGGGGGGGGGGGVGGGGGGC